MEEDHEEIGLDNNNFENLSFKDLQSLEDGVLLNDSIIYYYLRFIIIY